MTSKSEALKDKPIVAGMASAGLASLLTGPLDVLKVIFQVQRNKYASSMELAKELYSTHGVGRFFRGTAFRVALFTPSAGIAIVVFDKLKEWFAKVTPSTLSASSPGN
jgi:solute carrier family 25 protein 38